MGELTDLDKRNLERARRLARQAKDHMESVKVVEALHELDPHAVLTGISCRTSESDGIRVIRARVTVIADKRHVHLVGTGASEFSAILAAIDNGYQPTLPGLSELELELGDFVD
jgi:hypothetical protein